MKCEGEAIRNKFREWRGMERRSRERESGCVGREKKFIHSGGGGGGGGYDAGD